MTAEHRQKKLKTGARQEQDRHFKGTILHLEIYINFEKKVTSTFCTVLLTLQSYATGETEYDLKVSIKSSSSPSNSAQLAYETLLQGIEGTTGGVGKENEKVL